MPIELDPAPAGPTIKKDESHPSRSYPERPLIGVGAVVFRGDLVLLIRRRNPPRAGEWSLPGGLQRLGETVADAARREVAEETGIEITIGGLVDVVDLVERDNARGRVRYHYTLIDVSAEWLAGEPVAASDAVECRWFTEDEACGLDLWRETVRIIRLARRRRIVPAPRMDDRV